MAMNVKGLVTQWSEGHSVMSTSLWLHGLHSPWNSPGQNTGVGSLSFLQGIFPTLGSNLGFPLCRWIPYQLSHQGSPAGNEASLKIHDRVRGTSWLVNKWRCWKVGREPSDDMKALHLFLRTLPYPSLLPGCFWVMSFYLLLLLFSF